MRSENNFSFFKFSFLFLIKNLKKKKTSSFIENKGVLIEKIKKTSILQLFFIKNQNYNL
jgi:hypothetical protein